MEKWAPGKGSCTISEEGRKDSQRQLWTLVHIYLVDMDFLMAWRATHPT